MDPATKESVYHSAAYGAAGTAIMDFKPINQIHQHLCAFHTYAVDRTRHVEAHHFCTHLTHEFHQCIIYDSDKPNARLIGIEYIITEDAFLELPKEEHKYWHSHKYEASSGLLRLNLKSGVPGKVSDIAEQPAMLVLQKTYGKTIHTWQFDIHPDFPLGPPTLMMSYTSDSQLEGDPVLEAELKQGEAKDKRPVRKDYLPEYQKVGEADEWEKTGESVAFDPVMEKVKWISR
ncbi:hypothetical protein M422DRAFT_213059 [Sphaerobolus stellatus SS14]|uniref:Unplaced genomic scaffold SPHSTscaffold_122, whole genome shotgun sequence n=1 Tax=Sphaerobolus stellatus (strain SS14) TaxID=990650 RepID=A0A0C9VAY0_SPHS4|nr:hypothetical protein M422DRAFT_195257 [Sphaerobolus stellatus SS14]KIJ34655.1 hypothetical protein M422DRAFT_213059 [Sphaerobolus stellatus SS14]